MENFLFGNQTLDTAKTMASADEATPLTANGAAKKNGGTFDGGNILNVLQEVATNAGNETKKIAGHIGKKTKEVADKVGGETQKIGGTIAVATGALGSNISKGAGEFGGNISKGAEEFGGNISRTAGEIGGNITRTTGEIGGNISRTAGEIGGNISRGAGELGGNISRTAGELGGNIAKASGEVTMNVQKAVADAPANFEKVGTQVKVGATAAATATAAAAAAAAAATTAAATAAATATATATSAVATATATYVTTQTGKVVELAHEPVAFQTLAYVGGFAMAITGLVDLILAFQPFSFPGILVSTYSIVFGVIIAGLEGAKLDLPQNFETTVRFHFRVLDRTFGRGLMYAFAGSLLFVQPSVLNVVVGLYMVFVGFIAFRVAKRATERLNEIHTGVQTEDELRAKFDEHKTTEGTLRKPEFAAFCVDLGVLVTYQELVDCFTTMDKNDDEEVTFEEISGWWSSWGSHNLPALSAATPLSPMSHKVALSPSSDSYQKVEVDYQRADADVDNV
jgi:hypothetical protein